MKLLAIFAALVSVAFAFPASTVTGQAWSLNELSEALQDPSLNPEIKPYLEAALNQLMSSIFAGGDYTSIMVAVPAGVPVLVPEVEPVVVEPVVVAPAIVDPVPVATPDSASALPLVQIIVNIDQSASAGVSPAVVPELVSVVEPSPVQVVEVAPEPVQVVEVAPEAVVVVESAPSQNPIDTIAIEAPNVNPVDILHPVPNPAGAIEIGPLV